MSRVAVPLIFVLLIGLALVVLNAVYIVDETKQVVITQFGKPVGDPISEPGLHTKIPFVQKVNEFEKRYLEWDGDPNKLTTRDKRYIFVEGYARWRIENPLLFLQSYRDSEQPLSSIDAVLDGETRKMVAKHDFIELVRDTKRIFAPSEEDTRIVEPTPVEVGRRKIALKILEAGRPQLARFGIEVLDFRFKRINYQPQVREKVYERMRSERQRIAALYIAEGNGEQEKIKGEKTRQLNDITSTAERRVREIRGEADAEAARIANEAYSKNVTFFRFLKRMELLQEAIDNETTLLLTTEGDFLQYLKGAGED